jgi:broad specificity phosphatase PhoE
MPPPLLYYIRHGETDWNVEARLQGGRDIPINAAGRAQARRSGEILRELLARDGRDAESFDFVASPLGRARETMEIARAALGLNRHAYRTDARLVEVAFGRWEGFSIEELRGREADAVAARERDKWDFVPPQGESYAAMSRRVATWYAALTRDTVAVAHGGTFRGLLVRLGIMSAQEAPVLDIAQGVVYLIADGRMTRYA